MTEYIIEIPDEYLASYDTKRDMYYPDERDSAMPITPIVRCRDCAYICNREYANGLEFHTCSYFDSEHAEVEPDGFCAWGKRSEK